MSEPATHGSVDPARSDPGARSTLVVGAVSVIVLVVVVLLLEALHFRTAEAERYRKVVAEPPLELRQIQAEQLGRLNGYRWIDRPNGVVAIPIERAMELVVQESAAATGAPEADETRWQR